MEDISHKFFRQICGVRRREQGLYMLSADEVQEFLPARAVQLTHDVIEQKHRIFSRLRAKKLQFGKLQGEDARALLPLRTEGAKVDAVHFKTDVIPLRADARRAAQDIKIQGLLQLLIIPWNKLLCHARRLFLCTAKLI